MKKLYIIAIMTALSMPTFASSCNDVEESQCYLWDVSLNLKTLGPKSAKCGSRSVCGDEADPTYYLDNTTRKIKGYIWSCEYSCDTWNIVLWDEKNKVALIPLDVSGENQTTISAEDALVFGKKAKSACATFQFVDEAGEKIDVIACGMNGKLSRNNDDSCYVKSISGQACGKMAYVKPSEYKTVATRGGLCEDPVVETYGDEYAAKCLTWCDCCCFDNWCEDGEEAPEMVPCVGTWKMKFNKKLASGKKGNIAGLVPAYAL